MMKKRQILKKILDYKIKLTIVKMPKKCVAMPTIDVVQVICKPEAKKTGDSSNACVCLFRSLKLSTDDQVTSKRSQLKTYYIVLCNLRFN